MRLRPSLAPLLALVALLVTLGGCGPITFVVGASPLDRRLEQTTVRDVRGTSDRIAIIDVSGVLLNAERPALIEQGENPVSLFHEQLAAAAADDRVKAVVLRINSPGGAVTASDMMHRGVQKFRERTGKPVVALLMDVAASGGYYLACASDRIVAYPTSITGSIGVIVQTVSVKPALDRWGVQTDAITSGPNKAMGSPLEPLTPEHRAIMKGMVHEFYGQFVGVVKAGRPTLDHARLSEATDGRVVTGVQAVSLGLADRAGDLDDAAALAAQLAGIRSADLVRYHRPLQYVGSPYAGTPNPLPGAAPQVNLLQLNVAGLGALDTPVGVYYLWRPDLQ